MDKIVWNDDFSVGVPSIDKQHKRLIDMINAVADAGGAGVAFDTIMRMYAYADEHFRAEEALMRRYGYAGLGEQIRTHRNFSSKATELAGRDYTQRLVLGEVVAYLREWLTEHILKTDMAYKGCLSQERTVRDAEPTPARYRRSAPKSEV